MIKDNDFEMKCNCGDYHKKGVWECAIHGKQGSPIDPSPPKYVILPTWNSSGVEMTKESKLNSWSERKRLYDEINRKRKLKKSKNQESLEGSIFNCFLIEQKVKEWRHMIQKAINDPELKRTQLKDVQKKMEKLTDIIFHAHGRSKYTNELVNKIYYNYLDKIKVIKPKLSVHINFLARFRC